MSEKLDHGFVKCQLDFPRFDARQALTCKLVPKHRYTLNPGTRRGLLETLRKIGFLTGYALSEANANLREDTDATVRV